MRDDETYIFPIELPDRVSKITFTEITKSSANISWSFVNNVGEAFHYRIDCSDCSKPNIFPVDTNQTSLILRGLDASTQ